MALADAVSSAVAHWSLDETSGSRSDSVGSNTLTDNNTVASGTGMFSNAADFEASNSEYLSIADNAALSFGDEDFCIRLWVNAESLPTGTSSYDLVSKYETSGNQREYRLDLYGNSGLGQRFRFAVSNNGSSTTTVTANNFGTPSTATWYLIHAWHDSVNNLVGIAVNAGTADTAAHSTGCFDGTSPLHIGALGRSAVTFYFDGLIDDVVILDGYILDSTERTEDYNSGTGVAFADWSGGGGANIPAIMHHRRMMMSCNT